MTKLTPDHEAFRKRKAEEWLDSKYPYRGNLCDSAYREGAFKGFLAGAATEHEIARLMGRVDSPHALYCGDARMHDRGFICMHCEAKNRLKAKTSRGLGSWKES